MFQIGYDNHINLLFLFLCWLGLSALYFIKLKGDKKGVQFRVAVITISTVVFIAVIAILQAGSFNNSWITMGIFYPAGIIVTILLINYAQMSFGVVPLIVVFLYSVGKYSDRSIMQVYDLMN